MKPSPLTSCLVVFLLAATTTFSHALIEDPQQSSNKLRRRHHRNLSFEKFTDGAAKVVSISQEEARRMDHSFVGTEHLLLGTISQRKGIGAKALRKQRVTLREAQKEIEVYIGRGTGSPESEIPFTPRAKRVLEMSGHEAKDLGQNFVGTEHILLAIIAESDGVAVRTLDIMNVDLHKLRNVILEYIEASEEP